LDATQDIERASINRRRAGVARVTVFDAPDDITLVTRHIVIDDSQDQTRS
jgi:hypothetical protein